MPNNTDETCDVAIVGGGPAGLALARQLKANGINRVVVLERENHAGGVPRHCGHYPFGIHEFRRVMKGPDYARHHVETALKSGIELRTGVTVTDLLEGGTLKLTSNTGVSVLGARRVALCTGVREQTRAQRLISGSRPKGVITTGTLQALVYLEKLKPFRRPVILGTELVSFSSLLTCHHAGIRPVAMVEPNPRITAFALSRGLPLIMGVPLFFDSHVSRIIGKQAVEAIEITNRLGKSRTIEADGLICTGGFRPEAALARDGHLKVDPGTLGPVIDQFSRASDPAYFCAGNLLRPVETHSWCAREGRQTANVITEDLEKSLPTDRSSDLPLTITHPSIRYVLPQLLSRAKGTTAMEYLQLRVNRPVKGKLFALADGAEVWSRMMYALPERRLLIPLAPIIARRDAASIEIGLREENP